MGGSCVCLPAMVFWLVLAVPVVRAVVHGHMRLAAKWAAVWIGFGFFALFGTTDVMSGGPSIQSLMLTRLATGWFTVPLRWGERMLPDPATAMGWSATACVMLGMIHWLMRWARRAAADGTTSSSNPAVVKPWPWRGTLLIGWSVVLMLGAGGSLAGMAHETAWLSRDGVHAHHPWRWFGRRFPGQTGLAEGMLLPDRHGAVREQMAYLPDGYLARVMDSPDGSVRTAVLEVPSDADIRADGVTDLAVARGLRWSGGGVPSVMPGSVTSWTVRIRREELGDLVRKAAAGELKPPATGNRE